MTRDERIAVVARTLREAGSWHEHSWYGTGSFGLFDCTDREAEDEAFLAKQLLPVAERVIAALERAEDTRPRAVPPAPVDGG